MQDKFLFVNPFTISQIDHKPNIANRARALADRLICAAPNQLVMVPCNLG